MQAEDILLESDVEEQQEADDSGSGAQSATLPSPPLVSSIGVRGFQTG